MIAERLTGTEPPDVIERHRDRYRRAIQMAGRQGGVWWDAACGTGYGMLLLPAKSAYGFDRDPPRQCMDSTVLQHFYLRADLAQGGWSSEAPDPDVVLSIETLEHLTRPQQDGFVAEIAARLNPGGVFVLACPLGHGPNPDNPWHVHEPTRGDLRRLLERHFAHVRIEVERYESTSGPAVQAFAVCR